MTPAAAKSKGRRLQQWVRDMLLKAFPALAADDVKSTSMGAGGEDVQLSPAARKLFPYSVECKSRKNLKTIYDMLEQAKKHGKGFPLVVLKADRQAPIVLVDAEHFIELTRALAMTERTVVYA